MNNSNISTVTIQGQMQALNNCASSNENPRKVFWVLSCRQIEIVDGLKIQQVVNDIIILDYRYYVIQRQDERPLQE